MTHALTLVHGGVSVDATADALVVVHGLGHGLHGVRRGDGGVDVDFHQIQRGDAQLRTRGLRELEVGVHHAAHQGLNRVGNGEVGRRVEAQQQAAQADALHGFNAARHGRAVEHSDQIAQAGGAHSVGQFAHRERAVVWAQARHHRAAITAALALHVGAVQQHRAGRADGSRVQAQVVAYGELTVHQLAIDERLRSRDGVSLVVAHQDGLRDLAQVHGVHAQAQ